MLCARIHCGGSESAPVSAAESAVESAAAADNGETTATVPLASLTYQDRYQYR